MITDTTPTDALESLALQARNVKSDAAAEAGQGGEFPGQDEAPEGPSNEQIIASALEGAREVFCGFTKMQSPRQTLHDGAVAQLAGVWSRVLDKHGIQLSRYMGDYGLEVAAAFATVHVGIAVYAGVRAEAEVLDRARQAKESAPQGEVFENAAG